MIVVLLSYSLPLSRFCLITQGALRDETKAAAGGRLPVMPMITIGNLWFLSAIGNCRYNPFFFFKSSVGFISSRTALRKTSGMSQNIGVTSLTTLGVIQEPIVVIPKSATYSLYSLFVVVVVFFFVAFFRKAGASAKRAWNAGNVHCLFHRTLSSGGHFISGDLKSFLYARLALFSLPG